MMKQRTRERRRRKSLESQRYMAMVPGDGLYRGNLKRLRDPDFGMFLVGMARDINCMLLMDDQQFWNMLDKNESARTSLQSCLSVFSRRSYERYSNIWGNAVLELDKKDEIFGIYSALMQVVLFVYYRISKMEYKYGAQIVYDEWLLDIPKLLDLAAIYGESNGPIVSEIISNVYAKCRGYRDDTDEFFNLIYRHELLACESREAVDFSPKSLMRWNFGNREKFMMEETTREIFRVKDLLGNLNNFMEFFPREFVVEFATDYKIQERLLRGMAMFLKESSQDWKMGDFGKYFQCHLEDVRQTIAIYFFTVFRILRRVLSGEESKVDKNTIMLAEDTYETLCLCFTERKKEKEYQYYKRMVNHLFQESDEIVFFIPEGWIGNVDETTYLSIEECVKYEVQYRKQKKKAGKNAEFQECYERFRQSLDRYSKITTKRDGINVVEMQKQRQQERKNRDAPPQIYLNIFKLKYGNFGAEYNDQPEERDSFKRFQEKMVRPTNKYIKTDLDIYFGKDGGGKREVSEMNLSVWDLSQIQSKKDRSQFESYASDDCFERDGITYKRQRPPQMKNPMKKEQKQIDQDLSIFEIEISGIQRDNLSFSLTNNEKQRSAYLEGDDKSDLETILANIDKNDQSEIHDEDERQNQEAQYYKFSWEQEGFALMFTQK